QVSADAKKTTRLAVYAGNSTIKAARKRTEVPPGFGSKALSEKPPTPPTPLPRAPRWITTSASVLVDRGAGSPPFVAEYDVDVAGRPTAEFHVQLARDAGFADVVVDERVPRTTTRFEANAPSSGIW